MKALPYGLKAYKKGEFDELHQPGGRNLTASNIAALFGKSPWSGRFGLACHVTGSVPFPEIASNIIQRGRDLELVSAMIVAREKGWKVEAINAYAEHPTFKRRVTASPDMLAWKEGEFLPGIGEGKVVAAPLFQDRWADGPPIYVELQHQLQLRCTGATWGFISALIVGDWRLDLVVYETKPNKPAMKIIDTAVGDFFKIIDSGSMPDPDPHEDSLRALHSLYPKADPGLIVLCEDEKSIKLFDDAVAARQRRLEAEKIEDEAKAHFKCMAKDAGLVKLPKGRNVLIKVISRGESVVKASSYRRLDFEHFVPLLQEPAPAAKAAPKRKPKATSKT